MAMGCPHIRLQTICEGGAPKSQAQKKQPRSRSRSPVWQPEAEAVEEAEEAEQGFHMDAEEPEDSQLWNLAEDPELEQRSLNVTVSSEDPITITVPLLWPDTYVEKILARHMGVKREWLQFEWIFDDLFVLPARSAPAQLKDLVLQQFTLEQEADNARALTEEEQASAASPPAISTPTPKPSGIKPSITPQGTRQPIGAPRPRPEATPAKAMPKLTPATQGGGSSSSMQASSYTFESNVLARLDTIEKQQTEVLRLLRDTLRPLVTRPLATLEAQPVQKAKPTGSPMQIVGKKTLRGTRAGAFKQARAASHRRKQAMTPQGPICPISSQPTTGDLPSPPWRTTPPQAGLDMREGGATPNHLWPPFPDFSEHRTITPLSSKSNMSIKSGGARSEEDSFGIASSSYYDYYSSHGSSRAASDFDEDEQGSQADTAHDDPHDLAYIGHKAREYDDFYSPDVHAEPTMFNWPTIGWSEDDTQRHVISNSHDLEVMTGLYMDYSAHKPSPPLWHLTELDLDNTEQELKDLQRAVYRQSHLEGLEVVCTTPMALTTPLCPTHILPRPSVLIPDQGPSWFVLDSEYGSTHTPNTIWYHLDDAQDAETVYEDSDCEREAYDYTDFPQTTALIGLDLERGHQVVQFGMDSGAICNTVDLHKMTAQHLHEAELAERPDTLLPPEELEFPLGRLMCKRVKKAILSANNKQRWWQQVGSSPVSSPRTPDSRAYGGTSTLGESMEALDPFASYPLLSTGASYWREGGGKQSPKKRPSSRQLCPRSPTPTTSSTSVGSSPLPKDRVCDVDDIRCTRQDFVRLTLPMPATNGVTECNRSIQLVRLSSLAKHRNRGGWSHLYRINHHPSHTFADLGCLMAATLKVNRNKLCFFARVIDYLDDQFHRPMWRRQTSSTYLPLDSTRLLDHHASVYLHVEWKATEELNTNDMLDVATRIHDLKEGGGKQGFQRWQRANRLRRQILYIPMGDMAEHSLYASTLYIAGLTVNAHVVQALRDEIATIMQHALEHNQLIAGQTMEAWARDFHFSVNDLISMTNNEPTRDGNMLDGYLASLVLGCSIWMYPPEGQAYMQSHSPTPNYSIACNGKRYVVIVTPPATADQRAHFTYMHDTWSDLPLTLLRSPRAEAMENWLHVNIRETLDDRYIAKVFHHAHFPSHHVHIRYAILILSPDFIPSFEVPDQTYLQGLLSS
eukprot:3728576-Amphidinium_carterae.2